MTAAKKPAAAAKSAAAAPKQPEPRVAATLEDAVEIGLFGFEVDPTPDSNYTVAGVTSGKPTPETETKAEEKP